MSTEYRAVCRVLLSRDRVTYSKRCVRPTHSEEVGRKVALLTLFGVIVTTTSVVVTVYAYALTTL